MPPAVHLSPQLKKIKQKRGRITHRVKNTYSISFICCAFGIILPQHESPCRWSHTFYNRSRYSPFSFDRLLRCRPAFLSNRRLQHRYLCLGHGFIRRAITITNGPDPAIYCNNIIVSVDIQLRNIKSRRQAFQLLLPISVKAIMRITLNEKVAIATVFIGITKRRLQIVCGHQLRFDLLRCQKCTHNKYQSNKYNRYKSPPLFHNNRSPFHRIAKIFLF